MKMLLGILLLIVSVHSAAVVKRSADAIDLTEVNKLRNEIYNLQQGTKYQLPQLVYDKALEEQAKSLSANNCGGGIKNDPGYRVVPMEPDENAAKLVAFFYLAIIAFSSVPADKMTNELRESKERIEHEIQYGTAFHFELLNPAQTKIGCVPQKCTFKIPSGDDDIKAKLQLTGDIVVFNQICIIGPSGTWQNDQLASVEHAASKSNSIKRITEASGSVKTSLGMTTALLLCFSLIFF